MAQTLGSDPGLLVFVAASSLFSAQNAPPGFISARTLTQTRSWVPTCVREVVSPAPRTLARLCSSALEGEEGLMISSSQVSVTSLCGTVNPWLGGVLYMPQVSLT